MRNPRPLSLAVAGESDHAERTHIGGECNRSGRERGHDAGADSAHVGAARIASLNHRGEGVGKITSGPDQGLVVFVAGTVPGDLVEYSIIERKKNYMRGRVTRIVEAGSGRVEPPCSVASSCGGCAWQHLSYDVQLQWKKRIVEEALSRIARIEACEIRDCLPSPDQFGYRNKVEVPLAAVKGKIVAGFYQPYTHQIVSSEDCPLEHPLAREVVKKMVDEVRARKYTVYSEKTGRGQVRHVVARVAPGTEERMAVLVANGRALPEETGFAKNLASSLDNLVSVVLNTNTERTNIIMGDRNKVLLGRYHIEDVFGDDELGHLRFRLSPNSFYQVNTPQAARLYKIALDAAGIRPNDIVYDIYSGIGTITLFAAKRAALAVGIEEVGDAVRDAGKNADLNGVDNVRFREGRAERVISASIRDFGRPDVVILDPPRGGAEESVLQTMARAKPRSIVYVSCNPATLARDLITLRSEGFSPEWVQPVDMFPQTPHVECVVALEHGSNY